MRVEPSDLWTTNWFPFELSYIILCLFLTFAKYSMFAMPFLWYHTTSFSWQVSNEVGVHDTSIEVYLHGSLRFADAFSILALRNTSTADWLLRNPIFVLTWIWLFAEYCNSAECEFICIQAVFTVAVFNFLPMKQHLSVVLLFWTWVWKWPFSWLLKHLVRGCLFFCFSF